MCKLLALLFSGIFIATSLVALSSTPASAAVTLTTCTDLSSKVSNALKATQKSCKPLLAPAVWHLQQSDSPAHSGAGFATIRICSSQNPVFTYQYIKKSCPKYQVTTDYWRAVTEPSIPLITSSSASGYNGAAFTLTATNQAIDAPIAYYLITNIMTGQIDRVIPSNSGELSLSNLSPLTSYTFTIVAVSADGTSTSSSITPMITTGAVPVVIVAPAAAPLAAPAFTLSSSSETKTVNTSATGFTISSTGGAIASFAISATPAGMSFSTSTGALSGTPTSVASATTYTITATNASGTATRTFTLTVTALAAPAFTLTSSAETGTVNTPATGFTISSTGGAIASFAISATPAGMSFNLTTGALTGTPTSIASATAYTITATNARGSVTRTFRLTVRAPIVISAAAIAGVTAPNVAMPPVSTTTAGTGYTGTVAWASSGGALVGNFASATAYTATITLTPTSGYTLTGVTANFFTVAGATPVTNSANAGVITAVFYMVGATGPGGGKIFYVAATPFNCGPTLTPSCTYLEAASTTAKTNPWTDLTRTWSTGDNQTTSVPNASGWDIGTGYKNSLAIVDQPANVAESSAAVAARGYGGPNNLTDWYLPSIEELNELYSQQTTVGGFVDSPYWSSSESFADAALGQGFGDGYTNSVLKSDDTFYVRPVRAF